MRFDCSRLWDGEELGSRAHGNTFFDGLLQLLCPFVWVSKDAENGIFFKKTYNCYIRICEIQSTGVLSVVQQDGAAGAVPAGGSRTR